MSSCATVFGTHFGGIEAVDHAIHEPARGDSDLVIHGWQGTL